jgi:transcription elongation factor Elf1
VLSLLAAVDYAVRGRFDMFYLTFECPHCHQLFELAALNIEVFYDGIEIICPKCGAQLTIRILETGRAI